MKPKAVIETRSGEKINVWCSFDELIDISKVIPNPMNPNEHPKKQIELLSKIIRSQGFRRVSSISKNTHYLVTGHGRLEAAMLAGCLKMPIEYQEYENYESECADMIADNKLSELSSFDKKKLNSVFEYIEMNDFDFSFELTGFDFDGSKKLNDDLTADVLSEDINAETEQVESDDQGIKIDRIKSKLDKLQNTHPDLLKNASLILLDGKKGNEALILVDDSFSDIITELRRYIENGDDTPFARLINEVHTL